MATPDTFPQSPEEEDIEIPLDGLDQGMGKNPPSTVEMMRVFGMRIQELRAEGKNEQADKMAEMLKLLAKTSLEQRTKSGQETVPVQQEQAPTLQTLMDQTPDQLRATLHFDAMPAVRKWLDDVAREELVKDPTFNTSEFKTAMLGRPAKEIIRAYLIATEEDKMPDELAVQEEFIKEWRGSVPPETPLPNWLQVVEKRVQKQAAASADDSMEKAA